MKHLLSKQIESPENDVNGYGCKGGCSSFCSWICFTTCNSSCFRQVIFE